MINLNSAEKNYYQNVLKRRALNAPSGVVFKARWLFDKKDPVSARLCRRFFEEVSMGMFPNITKNGTRSRDGYTVL